MSHSSRLSISLLLIIFAALLVPITARAVVTFDASNVEQLLNQLERDKADCTTEATFKVLFVKVGFDPTYYANCLQTKQSYNAIYDNTNDSLLSRLESYKADCIEETTYGYKSLVSGFDPTYRKNCMDIKLSNDPSINYAAPSANVEPKDNWDLQGTREPLDNWDLQGRAPSTRALTPLQEQVQRYQAQFALNDTELQRIATSCGSDDLGMGQERCMNYMIGLYRGGNPLSSDVVKVQTYIQSQSSAPQPSAGNEAGCAAMYPNDGDYGRYLQCVTQGSSQSSSGGSVPNQSPYRDDPATDPYSFMQSCDNRYGANTPDANTCKEPILREMGISGSAQAQTPADYYGQYAPVETRSRDSALNTSQDYSYESAVAKGAEDDVGKFQTGPLKCWSWVASFWSGCENYKAESVTTADAKGGVTTSYQSQQFPAPVEERWAPTPRPYTREEEDALSRIAITAEDTIFTSSESSSGEFVTPGWMTRFKNWFTGDNTEPEQQYRSYVDRDTEYQTLGDGSTVLISTLGDEEYYYDDLGPLPYEPPAQAQYGTFVGPDSYCANEDCSVLINYTDEQPGSYGYDSDVNSAAFVPDTVLEPDTVPEPDPTADTGMDAPMWSVKFYDEESDSMIDTAPEGSGGWWNLWNSWDSSETQAKPTRQFSTAVPFSGELFNQSLAAGAFGAFLLKDKQKDAPAWDAREPFGNGFVSIHSKGNPWNELE